MPAPIVEVIGQETPDLRQSKFPELPKLPCRVLACAPSGGFKTTTILWVFFLRANATIFWMLMCGYVNKNNKPLFSRAYYFSKTAHVDPKLRELEKWAKKTLKQPEDEPVLYSEFDNATVERLLHEIRETVAYMKKKK